MKYENSKFRRMKLVNTNVTLQGPLELLAALSALAHRLRIPKQKLQTGSVFVLWQSEPSSAQLEVMTRKQKALQVEREVEVEALEEEAPRKQGQPGREVVDVVDLAPECHVREESSV